MTTFKKLLFQTWKESDWNNCNFNYKTLIFLAFWLTRNTFLLKLPHRKMKRGGSHSIFIFNATKVLWGIEWLHKLCLNVVIILFYFSPEVSLAIRNLIYLQFASTEPSGTQTPTHFSDPRSRSNSKLESQTWKVGTCKTKRERTHTQFCNMARKKDLPYRSC